MAVRQPENEARVRKVREVVGRNEQNTKLQMILKIQHFL